MIDRLRHRGRWKELPIDDMDNIREVEGTDNTQERVNVDRMLDNLDDSQRDLLVEPQQVNHGEAEAVDGPV
jgi:hypothetical protein